ncbi:MAG: hydroxymethylpyrimidine/phosphomethylpyrimidine kinase [Cytophagaceae bacterium]
MKERANCLAIAGLDPSAGAGLLADIKTFEQNKVYAFGISSASTVQNDSNFYSVSWVPFEEMKEQMEKLFDKFSVSWVKIGLIENLETLKKIIFFLKEKQPQVKIIWDPVLSASAGFTFHDDWKLSNISEVLDHIYMITPNWNEIKKIIPDATPLIAAGMISRQCKVYLKGGHNIETPGKDFLIIDGKEHPFNPKAGNVYPKHGSGCVLSSALTANLASGYTLIKSCLRSKDYTYKILKSNNRLLGYHHN